MSDFEYLRSEQDSMVALIPLTLDYASGLFQVLDESRNHLENYCSDVIDKYQKVEDMELSITSPNNPLRERFIILNSGVISGSINVEPVNFRDSVFEIGYWLSGESLRIGVASTATKLLSDHVLGRPSVEEIVGYTHPENVASQKTLQRAGFSLFGSIGVGENEKRKFIKSS